MIISISLFLFSFILFVSCENSLLIDQELSDSSIEIFSLSRKWRAFAGRRDRLVHDYFGVDYDIVWDVLLK